MSQEERLMILQMVADKKITVSEAAELLKALDGAPPMPPDPPPPQAGATPAVPPGPSASPAPRAPASGFWSGLSAFIEEIVERAVSAINDASGPRYEFPAEIGGSFAVDEVPLRILTGNGHVELKGWDRPDYRANILVKARGASEEEARRRAQEAYVVRASEHGFELESHRRHDWSDLAVSVTLYLPKERRYRLETRTGNGNISVEGIALAEGSGTSGNGRITFRGGSAHELTLRSGNGSIEVEGDVADLEAGTGNGSVRVIPLGRRSESILVKTGNGSITVDTGRLSREVGLCVEARTGMGRVSINRSDLTCERDERHGGHRHVIAVTPGYETAERRVEIEAHAGMGSIVVE